MTEVDHVIGNKEKMELNTLSLKNSQIKDKISDIMQLKSIALNLLKVLTIIRGHLFKFKWL